MAGIRKRLTRERSGFTLVELLLVTALMGVVLAIIYNLLFFAQAGWRRAAAESWAVQEARLVLLQMGREVRQAQAPSDITGPVVVSGGNQLEIYTDTTGDGRPERVTYRRPGAGVGGQPLQRSVTAPEGDAYPYTYAAAAAWETVIESLRNTDVFAVSGVAPRLVVNVRFLVEGVQDTALSLVEVRGRLTVRSKGAAE